MCDVLAVGVRKWFSFGTAIWGACRRLPLGSINWVPFVIGCFSKWGAYSYVVLSCPCVGYVIVVYVSWWVVATLIFSSAKKSKLIS